ncbi:MAG: DUF58 domain-containing protein [Thermoleophilia bacterium]
MSPTETRPFPLVPQRRFSGVRSGYNRSPRRGQGDDVAGMRPYRPGDRRAWIDWRASARLSAARGVDEFVVREFVAAVAPRVAIVVDRRPRMMLVGQPFPWLDKPAAVDGAIRSISRATLAEGGDLAYVEQRDGRALWLPPGPPALVLERRSRDGTEAVLDTEPYALDRCVDQLASHASILPAGAFVFVLSDFVEAASPRTWARLRALRWDVTPVVVQDPMWEQSFPDVGGTLLSLYDAVTGVASDVVLTGREARARAAVNEHRLEELLRGFARLGFDPIVLGSSEPAMIATAFHSWAARRKRLRRRSA